MPSKKKDANQKCPKHPSMDVLFVCKDDGDEFVCPHCVTTTHNGHRLVEISEFVVQKKNFITSFLREAQIELPLLLNKIESTDKKIQGNSKYFLDVISEIEKHCDALKSEIDRLTSNYTAICKQLEKENEDNLAKHKQELKFMHENMVSLVRTCQDVITTGSDIDIILQAKKIPDERDVFTDFPLRSAVFSAGNSTADQRLRVFGTILIDGEVSNESVTSLSSLRPIESLDTISEFEFSKTVHSICPTGDQAWLLERLKDEIVLVNQNGEIVRNIKCESKVTDISLAPGEDNLWIACKDRRIREVRTSTIAIVRFRVEDFPSCISCVDDVTIVVGMERKIAIYSSNGEVKQSMDKFSTIARMMKFPHHMSYSKDIDELAIVVNDNPAQTKSHITVVDGMLQLKYSYSGDTLTARNGTVRPASYTPAREFFPVDVCFDQERNLLITDANNKSLLVLKHKGKQLRTLLTEDLEPRAIGLRDDGLLWVSFNGGKVKVIRYREN